MRVAVLGAGMMGSAAVARLKSLGFEVLLWNRSIEKAEALAKEMGVVAYKSAAEAVSNAEVALAFLADDDAVLQTAASLPRADGLIFVNFSTVTPQASKAAAKMLENKGACYVESPLLGGPRLLREGATISLVSGPSRCFRAVKDVIEALSSDVIFVSESVGDAAVLKLAYNNLLISSIAILSESIAMIESYGADTELFQELLKKTVFKDIAEKYFNRVVAQDQPPSFKLSLAMKDMDYVCISAAERKIPMPIASSVSQLYKLAARAGYGDKDYTSIYRFMKSVGKER